MDKLGTAIIICSRKNSRRIHEKPFQRVGGVTILQRLIDRCKKTGLPVILAVPQNDDYEYYKQFKGCYLTFGPEDDPLHRMYLAANKYGVNTIVRVTHDKIFIDPELIKGALDVYIKTSPDYVYSSEFTPGTGFEIIRKKVLREASLKYDYVEHISYAIRSVTNNTAHVEIPEDYQSDARLLIDYPNDLKLMEVLFSQLGDDCTLKEVIEYIGKHRWLKNINRLPLVTVYTCAYNADEYLEKCISSVLDLESFARFEYLIIDDFSSDETYTKALKLTNRLPNVTVIKNQVNEGLATSSNIALKHARGEYIVRLDADDFFSSRDAVTTMVDDLRLSSADVLYPGYYHGSFDDKRRGSDNHHIGGALFKTRAINHIKFTDNLRGLEGLDFFERAKDQLDVCYTQPPVFFYRQRPDSMSKTNLAYRKNLQDKLDAGLTGEALL